MNVIVFASRKGGSGKSTLTTHLAAHANRPSRRCMLIDCDPQGSTSLWHKLRGTAEPLLRDGSRGGVKEIIEQATANGVEWCFVDTPPNASLTGRGSGSVDSYILGCRRGPVQRLVRR